MVVTGYVTHANGEYFVPGTAYRDPGVWAHEGTAGHESRRIRVGQPRIPSSVAGQPVSEVSGRATALNAVERRCWSA